MLTLRLLGGSALVTDDGKSVGRAAQKRRLALLAFLAARPGVAVTRDKLLALFWPEVSTDEARHRLSAALYDLRRALGDDVLVTRGDEVSVATGAIRCDAVEFESAVEAHDWHRATQLYRGPFLDGVHIGNAPEFEEWVDQRRTQLARSFGRSLEEWASLCTARGDLAAAVEAWQRLADTDPLNDRLALGLMKAYEAAGNRAGALRYAKLHEQRLRADLGVQPDHTVREYTAALRAAVAGSSEPAAVRAPADTRSPLADATAVLDLQPPPASHSATRRVKPKSYRTLFATAALLALFLMAPAALRIIAAEPGGRAGAIASADALRAVDKGEEHLQSGRFEAAVAAFERAVSLDSLLAMAHFRLAVATLWADQPGDKIDSRIERAFARRDRLDDFNRMLMEGFVAWRRGEWHQAEAVYRRALTIDPASIAARHELAEVLFHYNAPQGRSLDEARLEFERVADREPEHYGALWHLAQIAARDRRKNDVDRLTSRLLALKPDVVRTLEVQALRSAALNDAPGMNGLVDRLRDADESLLFGIGWRLLVFSRDLAAAERVFTLLTDPRRGPHAHAIGHMQLLYVDIARGDNDAIAGRLEALAELRNAGMPVEWLTVLTAVTPGAPFPAKQLRSLRDSLAAMVAEAAFQTAVPPRRASELLTTLGAVYAVLGDSARAQAIADRLEKAALSGVEPRRQSSVNAARAATIRALRARQAGRHEDVIQWTDRSLLVRWFGDGLIDPLSAYSIDRYIRADALLALGRSEEADAWFATIGDHDPSDIAFLGDALQQRALIASARGDRAAKLRINAHLDELRSDSNRSLRNAEIARP